MEIIVQIKYGSHLYGLDTADSDLDIKGVYIPEVRDILLQRVPPVVCYNRPKGQGEKNNSKDIDYELYNLQKFLNLLSKGHPVALEMLFAPDFAMLFPPKNEWFQIKKLAPQLLTKKGGAFVSYCKHQANKYGLNESRIAASRIALEFLIEAENRYGVKTKLKVIEEKLNNLSNVNRFLSVIKDPEVSRKVGYYFDICGKKIFLNSSIKSARIIAQHLVDEYNKIIMKAETNQDIDWKVLSHVVRLGHQAIELLTTNHITFPRPEAKHLLKIKQGCLPFKQISEEIERPLIDIEAAMIDSTLPNNFDPIIIDNFIEHVYGTKVKKRL
ncbi:hypothetical protein phytr_11130 [Candidatus Phycorickettsia trachydisci]|uniref:Nucleotidyltransferase n=1 Tax=Candidatus Phycorickettsia trachydisci TaxID=2115978 RepID=A0A2P1P9U9_9RICK|nr:nucleotidyltransferase domain-containing protein [Candidatus Phycorickettsia trachydisci]AVP88038.1 hypothetical protein phytr_11130 [Candidatus Phycorickettsia trachydisci]